MSSEENKEKFTVIEKEDRPIIKDSVEAEFRVGDRVYVLGFDGSRTDGPFKVASVSAQGCTLSLEDGQTARDGEMISIARLQAA